jgi:4-amino-4-deoxy-L-arabinose transferase-like glycosyltransferase
MTFPRLDELSRKEILALLFLMALAIRIPYLAELETAVFWWRPSDNASVARNFLTHGFNFLYPQIDWGGNGPGYVEMELPLVQFLTAIFYYLFGLHHELALVVPMLSSLAAIWLTFLIADRLAPRRAAVLAGMVAALSTSLVRFGQSFFVDPSMVCAGTLALYAMLRWADGGRGAWLLLSSVSVSIAILLKPTALVLGLPLAFLVWRRYGWRAVVRPSLLGYAVVALVPSVLWYAHAYGLGQQYGNSFGILSGGYVKTARLDIYTNPEFYARLAWWAAAYHLTPVGFLGAALGFCTRPRRPEGWLCHFWMAAIGVQALIAAEGNFVALYYQLLGVPAAAILAGVGLDRAIGWIPATTSAPHARRTIEPWWVAAVVAALAAGASYSVYRFRLQADFTSFGRVKAAQGTLAATVMRPGALMVYSANNGGASVKLARGAHLTPPDVFYFSGHRGWFVAVEWLTIPEIEALRAKGASYLVVSDYFETSIETLRRDKADVHAHLVANYPRVLDSGGVLVFDLDRPQAQMAGRSAPATPIALASGGRAGP